MKKTNIITALFIIAAAFGIPKLVNGKVWRVNNTPAYNQFTGAPPFEVFSNLGQAIGDPDVGQGDTLLIESSGTRYPGVTLNKKLVLIGTGYFLGENLGRQQNQTPAIIDYLIFGQNSSGSTIMGLNISGTASSGVALSNFNLDSIAITRCYINGDINFQNGAGIIHNRIIITKNFITGAIDQPAGSPGTITNLIFTNNQVGWYMQFDGTNHHGIVENNALARDIYIQGNIVFRNNIITGGTFVQNPTNSSTNIYNNLFSYAQPAWLTGGDNNFGVASNIIYHSTGTTDSIFTPKAISDCPQCYQGFPGGTAMLGMFGGSDPYILSGIPAIPTIYQLQTPVNAPQGGTIQGTISTRSNN